MAGTVRFSRARATRTMDIGWRDRSFDVRNGTAARRQRATISRLRTTSQPLLERLRVLPSLSRFFVLEIDEGIRPLGLMRPDRLRPLVQRIGCVAFVSHPKVAVRTGRDDRCGQLLTVGDTEGETSRPEP